MHLADLALVLVVGYLVGSFPTSIVAGRVFRGIDIRTVGSGNAGATNVFRVLGWRIGVPVAAIDIAKGLLPTLLLPHAHLFAPAGPSVPLSVAGILVGCVTVAGHAFPVYAGFRGGKGVATSAGVVFALLPLVGPVCGAVFALVLLVTGYVSLSSICAALSLVPGYLVVEVCLRRRWDPYLLGFVVLIAAAVTALHVPNIRRLLAGTERRFDRVRLPGLRKGGDREL